MESRLIAGGIVLIFATCVAGFLWRENRLREEAISEGAKRHKAALELSQRAHEGMIRMRASWADLGLTGDPKGVAEWIARDGQSQCGVTPDRRYYVVRNEFGSSRRNEVMGDVEDATFNVGWKRLGCEIAAPINQGKLIRIREKLEQSKAARELCFTFYQNPQLRDCLRDADKIAQ